MAIDRNKLADEIGGMAVQLWPAPMGLDEAGMTQWLGRKSADLHALAKRVRDDVAPEEPTFYVDLNPISKAVADFVKQKGFYTPSSLGEPEQVLAKLMLIVTEIGEAAEAVRQTDAQGAIDREEKGNFAEEMADTLIRMYDLCGSLGVDLGLWVEKKMAKNMGRPYRHGKVA